MRHPVVAASCGIVLLSALPGCVAGFGSGHGVRRQSSDQRVINR